MKNVSPQINSALISQPKTTQDKVAEKNETIDAGERETLIAERLSYADAVIAESELLTNLNHFTAEDKHMDGIFSEHDMAGQRRAYVL